MAFQTTELDHRLEFALFMFQKNSLAKGLQKLAERLSGGCNMNSASRFLCLVVFLVFGFSSAAFAEDICGTDSGSGVEFKYCIYLSTESNDVMYYMHGSGGSVKNWLKVDPYIKMREHWKSAGKALPHVIAVSFGSQWLLTDVPKESGLSLYQVFVEYVMPLMESKIANKSGRRLLMGESMGGLNSAYLYLRNGYLFDRVALNCPAVMPFGPQVEDEVLEAYMERHKEYVSKLYVMYMQNWGKKEFATEADWERNAPLTLARSLTKKSPSLYVSCGTHDQFGFVEGSYMLAEHTRSIGINTTWVPLENGGHCTISSKALSEFLRP